MDNGSKHSSHFTSCYKSNHHSLNPSVLIVLWFILHMGPRQSLVFGYEGSSCERTPPSTLHPSARNFIHSTSSPKLSNCRIASSCSSGKPKCFHFSLSSATATMPLEESFEQNHGTTIRTVKTRTNLRTLSPQNTSNTWQSLSPAISNTSVFLNSTVHLIKNSLYLFVQDLKESWSQTSIFFPCCYWQFEPLLHRKGFTFR